MACFNLMGKDVGTDKIQTCAGMKIAIVGGSLGGLATANVMNRLGATVTVFEKGEGTFEKRGACLGFVDVAQLQRIRGARFMRNGRQASLSQGAFYYGDVWQFLYEGLPEDTVKFGQTVTSLGDDTGKPTVNESVFDMAIIADGGWSTMRSKYFPDARQPEYAGHQIIWASVDTAELPGGLRSFDSQFGSTEGATYTSGIYDAVVLEAPKCDGSRMYACGFFIATPESECVTPEMGDNRQVQATRAWSEVPDWFLPFIRAKFGHHVDGEIVRFAEAAASKGKIAPNPVYEFAATSTVTGRVVVLGDAAHLSTPWTAAGAHTAILDAVGLGEVFSSAAYQSGSWEIDRALEAYDVGGVQRAAGLLRQSRACSRRLIPRGGKQAVVSPSTLVRGYHTWESSEQTEGKTAADYKAFETTCLMLAEEKGISVQDVAKVVKGAVSAR